MNKQIAPPIVGVGVLVTRENGQLLLGHRIKAGETPSWCFPGGHVEPNETLPQAARRELQEEAGVCLSDGGQVFGFAMQLTGPRTLMTGGVMLKLAESQLLTEVCEPHNFDEWRWFSADELPENLFPATRALTELWLHKRSAPGWIAYPVAESVDS